MNPNLALATVAALALMTAQSVAQSAYPERPVTVVVPYSPGGSTDVVTRVIAEKLGERLGQSFVVENLTGASGAIAWTDVARSEPDGYRILTTDMTLSIAPSLIESLPIDPVTSFDPISIAARVPHVLVVNPEVDAETVGELVELAKADPEALLFGSGGVGTNTHVTAEMFKDYAGIEMLHVPYQGAGAVLTDLMSGEVQVLFTAVPTALSHIQSGALRPLMVTSPERIDALPDVPSAPEAGFPEFQSEFWVGYSAPAGTPTEIVELLSTTIAEIVADPAVVERLAQLGYSPVGSTPAEAGDFLREEIGRWGAVVESAGIEPQ